MERIREYDPRANGRSGARVGGRGNAALVFLGAVSSRSFFF